MNGVKLMPASGDKYFFAPLNANIKVDEDQQVDVLNVFNGESPSNDVGMLTEDRLYGVPACTDTVIAGRPFQAGITYHNLEQLNLTLAYRAATLSLWMKSTHSGTTTIKMGSGNDTIDIRTLSGHTTVDLGAGADTVTVHSDDHLLNEIWRTPYHRRKQRWRYAQCG